MNKKNNINYAFIFTISIQWFNAATNEPGYPLGKFTLKKRTETFYATYVYPVDDHSKAD
jgi:hypothetical protein